MGRKCSIAGMGEAFSTDSAPTAHKELSWDKPCTLKRIRKVLVVVFPPRTGDLAGHLKCEL